MSPAYVLIVEDDQNAAQVLQIMLQRSGHKTRLAHNGSSAQSLIASQKFNVVILDLNLGKDEINGIDLLVILRERSPETAVILLTGYATLDSAIAAVHLGAHDYLLKPSSMEQIRQSVNQALQKQYANRQQQATFAQLEQQLDQTLISVRQALGDAYSPSPPTPPETRFINRDDLVVDFTRQIAFSAGKPLDLTLIEYGLLVYLIRVAPRLVTPQELVAQVHGYDSDADEAGKTIRPHISRLRRKLRQAGAGDVINTIRGRGYTID
jgi:DNA-binding response OmpR family regulator